MTNERIRTVEAALRIAATEARELRAMLEVAVRRADAPAPAPPARPAASDKSEALAQLCHDARTPSLTPSSASATSMLDERYGPIGNDRYRDYVGDVRRAGADLMALLLDAVDLASIEAGTFSLTPSTISLNEVVNDCVAQMQPEINAGHVIVRTSLSPSRQKITADPGAVRQVVANLLGYAIKGSRPGGQVIVSTGVDRRQPVTVLPRLRDNGEGSSEQATQVALQPAHRPRQATTPPRVRRNACPADHQARWRRGQSGPASSRSPAGRGEGSLFESDCPPPEPECRALSRRSVGGRIGGKCRGPISGSPDPSVKRLPELRSQPGAKMG